MNIIRLLFSIFFLLASSEKVLCEERIPEQYLSLKPSFVAHLDPLQKAQESCFQMESLRKYSRNPSLNSSKRLAVVVEFSIRNRCRHVRILNPLEGTEKITRNSLTLRVPVPASNYVLEADGKRIQIFIEVPIEKKGNPKVFDAFNKAQVFFEAQYNKHSTNSTSIIPAARDYVFFPEFGGKFQLPFPWWTPLLFGVEMRRSAYGGLFGGVDSAKTLSSTAFELRLQWQGSERSGRPLLATFGEIRSENIHSDSGFDITTLTSISLKGVGMSASSFMPNSWLNSGTTLSRWGAESQVTYFPNARSTEKVVYGGFSAAGGLLYRLNFKWAMSFGSQYSRINADFSKSRVPNNGKPQETQLAIYFRLYLLPYLAPQGGLR